MFWIKDPKLWWWYHKICRFDVLPPFLGWGAKVSVVVQGSISIQNGIDLGVTLSKTHGMEPMDWSYLPFFWRKKRARGRSPENMVWNLVRPYLHFRILFDSHWTISKFVQFWGPTGSRCLRPSWRRRTKDGRRRGGRWAVRWRSCWLMSSSCGTWSISYRDFMGGSLSCCGYNWRSHVVWWL